MLSDGSKAIEMCYDNTLKAWKYNINWKYIINK